MNSKFYFLLLAAVCFCSTKICATDVSGNQSGTWTKANSPYIITGNIVVANGTTLTIEPGVTVQIPITTDSTRFTVKGTLIAQGTATDSIHFIGSSSTVEKHRSGPIVFEPESINSVVQYASFTKLGYLSSSYYLNAIVIVRSNSCKILNCTFQKIVGSIIQIYKSSPMIEGNKLSSLTNAFDVLADLDKIRFLRNNSPLKIGITADFPVALDDTLPGSNKAYTLINDQVIPSNISLVIKPGARITFWRRTITVRGTLKAQGTKSDSIYLVGDNISTQGESIIFTSESIKSVLEYVSINKLGAEAFSDLPELPALAIETTDFKMSHCTVQYSNYFGLKAYTYGPEIDDNFFYNPGVTDVGMHVDGLRNLKRNNRLKVSVGGTMNFDDTLSDKNTYVDVGLEISVSKTLFINSGVHIEHSIYLRVKGALKAQGSITDSIYFNNGSDFYNTFKINIIILPGSKSVMQYVVLNGHNLGDEDYKDPLIKIEADSCSITNCTFKNFNQVILGFENPHAVIVNNVFEKNKITELNSTVDNLRYLGNNSPLKIGIEEQLMTVDDTLSGNNLYYRFLSKFVVPEKKILVIEPGAQIQFHLAAELRVSGTLKAQGDVPRPITFIGDRTGSGKKRGPVIIEASSINSVIQYANFSKLNSGGTTDSRAALIIRTATFKLANCIFSNNRQAALSIENATSFISERNCFYYNDGGIVSNGGNITVSESNFIDNKSYAINNKSTSGVVHAENCFWGDVSGPTVSNNPDGTGGILIGNVLYKPFATEQFDCAERVLPLTLTDFKAAALKSFVNLTWQTATEVNTSYFNIQRSTNRIEFANIGKVASSGNSTVVKSYEFLDKQPNSGINYYRLQMVDADGRYAYSKVIPVNMVSAPTFSVYPNPAKNTITAFIQSDKQQKVTMRVTDIYGKIVKLQQVQLQQGANNIYLNTASLAKGMYAIVVQGINIKAKPFVKE